MTSFFFDQVCSKIGNGNAAWIKQCKGLIDLREKMSDQEDSGVCLMSKDQGACFAKKFQQLIVGKIGSPDVAQKQEKPAEQKVVVKPQVQKAPVKPEVVKEEKVVTKPQVQKAPDKPESPKIRVPSPQFLVMKSSIHMMSPVRKTSNSGSACKYEIMITKYIGKGNICQEVSDIESKIHQAAQGFNMMIYGEMVQFYKKANDPKTNVSDGKNKCDYLFNHNGALLTIRGANQNVCQHYGKAEHIVSKRDAELEALYGQRQRKIEKGMHEVTMDEMMNEMMNGRMPDF